MFPLRPAVALLSLALTSAAFAQSGAAMHPPQNVVSFQSSASTEVAQDQMRLTLNTTLEGSAAQEVQGRTFAVKAALAEAKPQAQAEKWKSLRTAPASTTLWQRQQNHWLARLCRGHARGHRLCPYHQHRRGD